MKTLLKTIATVLAIAVFLQPSAVTAQGSYVYGLASQILDASSQKSKSKKAQKIATDHTQYFSTFDGDVPMMRVPEESIKSAAKSDIKQVQNELEKAHDNFVKGDETKLPVGFVNVMERIAEYDPDWVVTSYWREANFYALNERKMAEARRIKQQQEQLDKQEEKRQESKRLEELARAKTAQKDSLERVQRLQRINDGKRADSLAYVSRTKGFHFVNTEMLNLRENPNVSSKVIAQVGACSYVTIIPGHESNGWTKIDAGNYQGYVNEDYLVDNLDDITVTGADVAFAKKTYFTSVETAATYAAPYRRAVDTRIYYTGPRGGCYYINGNGRKEYVDHSFCN